MELVLLTWDVLQAAVSGRVEQQGTEHQCWLRSCKDRTIFPEGKIVASFHCLFPFKQKSKFTFSVTFNHYLQDTLCGRYRPRQQKGKND